MAIWSGIFVTAAGAAIANFFQNRSWDHQQEVAQKQTELKNATALFETLSTDMDFRLYSMRQICWAIVSGEMKEPEIQKRWEDYRTILYNWNKNLNKNFSLVDRYFGHKMRMLFEGKAGIQNSFSRLHRVLYDLYYSKDRPKGFRKESFDRPAAALYKLIRKANVGMIHAIQNEQVGVFNPEVDNNVPPDLSTPDFEVGLI